MPSRGTPAERASTAIERALAVFEASWADDEADRIAASLAGWVEPSREVLFTHLLVRELTLKRRAGSSVSASDYTSRFPEYAPVVEALVGDGAPPSVEASTIDLRRARARDGAVEAPTIVRRRPRARVASDASPADGDGDRLGPYELLGELGRGGMGVVYRARHVGLDRTVALKTIIAGPRAGPGEMQRFQVEAEAAAQLDHPGIVPLYEVGEDRGVRYLSMALVEGPTLDDRLAEGPLAPAVAARIVEGIARAVAYAHERGVIHRDLKPSNVLVDANGDPRVTDFGLAKRLESGSDLTLSGQVMGTPSYMSPEQATGRTAEIGIATDVYAIGAILYATLTGRPPFQSDEPVVTVLMVTRDEPVPPRQLNRHVPADLETVCLKCLSKEIARRYATAGEVADELARFLAGEPVRARRIGALGRTWRWCRRRPAVAGLVAAVALTLVAGTAVSSYFALLAHRRAADAVAGTRAAVRTLETMIFEVQERLVEIPQTRALRRDLLKRSLEELEAVAGEIRFQREVDRGTAVALKRLGELFRELGDEGETRASARRHLEGAVEMFESLLARSPDDPQALRDAAGAHDALVGFHLFDWTSGYAGPSVDRSIELWRRVGAREGATLEDGIALAYAIQGRGDVLARARAFAAARAELERADEILATLERDHPGSDEIARERANVLEKMGDAWFDEGDLAAAGRHLARSHAAYLDLAARAPDGPERWQLVAISWERQGNLALAQGRHDDAVAAYRRMRELQMRTAATDPENLLHKTDVALAHRKLAKALTAAGRTGEAAREGARADAIDAELEAAGAG